MNILYITQVKITEKTNSGLYWDLMTSISELGHSVTVVSGDHDTDELINISDIKVIKVKTAKQFGVGLMRKGIAFLSLPNKFKKSIKKHLSQSKFELIVYEAPPVMIADVIAWCKKKYKANTYLMQKDIFPQNALDLGVLSRRGLKGIAYKFFKAKEAKLYKLSDTIGCMSKGNIEYLHEHSEETVGKCELFPNSINPSKIELMDDEREALIIKYKIDKTKTSFVYGGNLGKPQGISELLKAIAHCDSIEKAQFILVGKGTEKEKVKDFCVASKNADFYEYIPKEEYDKLMMLLDVGIVALDHRSTIPNYPSRALAYMNSSIPILASTDNITDFRCLIESEAKCGLWNEATDVDKFGKNVKFFCENGIELKQMGIRGNEYMLENFNVQSCANKIISKGNENK